VAINLQFVFGLESVKKQRFKMRYQNAAKAVGWIEVISSTVILIFFLIGTYAIFSNPRILEEEMMADPSIDLDPKLLNANVLQKVGYMTPGFLYFIGEIVLGAYLLKAASELNYKKLRLWYIVTATYSAVLAVILIPTFFVCETISLEVILIVALCYAFTGYSLHVVHLLRNEIKKNSLPTIVAGGHMMASPPPYDASFHNVPLGGNEKQFMQI